MLTGSKISEQNKLPNDVVLYSYRSQQAPGEKPKRVYFNETKIHRMNRKPVEMVRGNAGNEKLPLCHLLIVNNCW